MQDEDSPSFYNVEEAMKVAEWVSVIDNSNHACATNLVNSSSCVSWLLNSTLQVTLTMVVHHESWMVVASCVDLTTPLDHEILRSSIDI